MPTTFSTLSKQDQLFHTLPLDEQLVVMQNTAIEVYAPGGYLLTKAAVDWSEYWDVFRLITPGLIGPFAASYFESRYAAYQYLPHNMTPEMMQVFERAVQGGYWQKYLGLLDFDYTNGPHNMGSIVHALNLLGEAHFGKPGNREVGYTMSPGGVLPSYARHIIRKPRNALVIGAFSVKSVQDIWTLWQYVLGAQTEIQVIDIEGVLTPIAAEHYGIPFSHMNGVATRFPDASYELVLANYLILDICCTREDAGSRIAAPLFREISRILIPGGQALLIDRIEDEPDEHLLCQADVYTLASEVGLVAQIHQAKILSRVAVEQYAKDGDSSPFADADDPEPHVKMVILLKE